MSEDSNVNIPIHAFVFVHEISAGPVEDMVMGNNAPPWAIAWGDQVMAEKPWVLVFCGLTMNHEDQHLPLAFRRQEMVTLVGIGEQYQAAMTEVDRRRFRKDVAELRSQWEQP